MKYILIALLLFPLLGVAQTIPEPPQPPPQPKVKNEILDFPEKEATYPGGNEALMKDLKKNIVYPDSAKNNNIQGKVYVSFVVEKDGSLSQIKVIRGIGFGCDESAINAVKKLKTWIPAENKKKPVRQLIRLPIIFKLQ